MDIMCPRYAMKEAVIRSEELVPLLNLVCVSKSFNSMVGQRLALIGKRNVVRKSSQADICSYLALNGWLSLLQEAVARGYKMDYNTMDNAAYGGHLECMQYARQNGCKSHYQIMFDARSVI